MTVNPWVLAAGPIVGLGSFVLGVVTLDGVLTRPDETGQFQYRLDNVWEFVKLPFNPDKYDIAWGLLPNISLWTRLKLLNLNWVVMVGLGTMGSTMYYLCQNKQ
jgi:hypothetical protein